MEENVLESIGSWDTESASKSAGCRIMFCENALVEELDTLKVV